jgi:hypothetical protein
MNVQPNFLSKVNSIKFMMTDEKNMMASGR